MAKRSRRGPPAATAALPPIAEPPGESLLDVVDRLIDKGVVVDGEVVLGLVDIDLIYLRLGALVAAADRVLEPAPGAPRRRRSARPARSALAAPPRRERPAPAAALPIATSSPARPAALVPPNRPGEAAQDDTSRSVIRLVLTLVEFVRGLLERQAIRRVESQTLNADETERLGRALMLLEQTIHDLAARHGIDPEELNLDLGPLGRLR